MNARVAVPTAFGVAGWLTFAGGIPRTPAGIFVALITGVVVGALLGAGVAAYRSRGAA